MLIVMYLAFLVPGDEAEKPYYVTRIPTKYLLEFGELRFRGTINEAGDFVPDPGFKPYPLNEARPFDRSPPLRRGLPKEPVYEYRSGRLIPGILDKGAFIPDLGSAVIPFEDYRCKPGVRRIYNLPGKFVTRRAFEEMKEDGLLSERDLEFNKDR